MASGRLARIFFACSSSSTTGGRLSASGENHLRPVGLDVGRLLVADAAVKLGRAPRSLPAGRSAPRPAVREAAGLAKKDVRHLASAERAVTGFVRGNHRDDLGRRRGCRQHSWRAWRTREDLRKRHLPLRAAQNTKSRAMENRSAFPPGRNPGCRLPKRPADRSSRRMCWYSNFRAAPSSTSQRKPQGQALLGRGGGAQHRAEAAVERARRAQQRSWRQAGEGYAGFRGCFRVELRRP